MDMAVTSSPAFTAEEVRDEAMTLVLAGHETTALTLTWAWHLLSHHPEQLAWLHEELDGLANPPHSFADLANVPAGGRLPVLDDFWKRTDRGH